MAIIINGKPTSENSSSKKRGHTQPKKPPYSLDEIWRVRKAHMQYYLGGISQSALDDQLKKSKWREELMKKAEGQDANDRIKMPRARVRLLPQPDGFDPRPYWLSSTVKKFLFG